MRTAYMSVSVIALGLALGLPANAQQTMGQTGGQTGAATVTTGAPSAQRLDRDQIEEKLGEAGIEDREEFKGQLIRTQAPEGYPVLLVIGPENMAGDESVDVNEDELRGKLTANGFSNVEFVDESEVLRGTRDDKAVLAIAGGGWQGTGGAAQADNPDMDLLQQRLGDAGLEDREEFEGELVRAQIDGQTLLVLVGPEEFAGDESVEFSAADLLMVTVLHRASKSGIVDAFPNLAAYLARGQARPAYQRAFDAQFAVFEAAQQGTR